MKFKANTVYVATKISTGKRIEVLSIDPKVEIAFTIEKGKIKEYNLREFKNYKQLRAISDKEKHFLKTFAV